MEGVGFTPKGSRGEDGSGAPPPAMNQNNFFLPDASPEVELWAAHLCVMQVVCLVCRWKVSKCICTMQYTTFGCSFPTLTNATLVTEKEDEVVLCPLLGVS